MYTSNYPKSIVFKCLARWCSGFRIFFCRSLSYFVAVSVFRFFVQQCCSSRLTYKCLQLISQLNKNGKQTVVPTRQSYINVCEKNYFIVLTNILFNNRIKLQFATHGVYKHEVWYGTIAEVKEKLIEPQKFTLKLHI